MKRWHAWIESKTGVAFGAHRVSNSDALIHFRLGDGRGRDGLCKFEAAFIWWFVWATWGEEWSKTLKERR
jgi:hypothetical protein